ncbi:MAG TPA: 3-dehydroquinate synthase [Polyangiaceae bacterium]
MLPKDFRPSELHEQRFAVEFDYPVVFGRRLLDEGDPTLAWAIARREPERRHPVFVVLDRGLLEARPELASELEAYVQAHREALELRAPPYVVPGGEASKNDPELVSKLLGAYVTAKLDRQASVIVVGGGAVLDAAGYAASLVHRGVRAVRLPSTVLSQCDGGVGVKNGVNAHATKNLFGTFAPPHAVVNDLDLLRTLPLRDARAGMAEAVKVALIRDGDFFAWIEANADALGRAEAEPLGALVRRCAALHLGHIARGGDPFEMGSARPLDYGHWAAHKLEVMTGHELRHGEAVAIGMLLDARYAERVGLLPAPELERLSSLLARLGLPAHHPALARSDRGKLAVLAGLEDFREHLGGSLTITLLERIGRGREVTSLDEGVVADAVAWLGERGGRA